MAEETIKFNVEYDVKGIDGTIRSSQRLLYFVNSIRLTIVDFQKLLEKPSLETAFWAALQLSYVWTNLIRLINQANRAAAGGSAINFLGAGGAGRAAGRAIGGGFSWGGTGAEVFTATAAGRGIIGGTATQGLIATVTGLFLGSGPVGWLALGAVVAAGATIGIVSWDINRRNELNDYIQKQREIAKNQGLEY